MNELVLTHDQLLRIGFEHDDTVSGYVLQGGVNKWLNVHYDNVYEGWYLIFYSGGNQYADLGIYTIADLYLILSALKCKFKTLD